MGVCILCYTFSKTRKYTKTRLTFLTIIVKLKNFINKVLTLSRNRAHVIESDTFSISEIHFEFVYFSLLAKRLDSLISCASDF